MQTEVSAGVYSDVGVQPTAIGNFEEETFLSNYVNAYNGPKADAMGLDIHHPLPGYNITYGYRSQQYLDELGTIHRGVDLPTNRVTGIAVRAVISGTIENKENYATYGKYVVITDYENHKFVYAHLADWHIEPDQVPFVLAGKDIGECGTTGPSSAIHLHYEVNFGGVPVDPNPFLPDGITTKYGTRCSDSLSWNYGRNKD